MPLRVCVTSCSTLESRPCNSLGSIIEPVLLAEVWVSQSQSCEHGRALPITHLFCGIRGIGKMPSFHLSPSLIELCGRALSKVIRLRVLPLPVTSYKTCENRFYSLHWQNNRANPIGRGTNIWELLQMLKLRQYTKPQCLTFIKTTKKNSQCLASWILIAKEINPGAPGKKQWLHSSSHSTPSIAWGNQNPEKANDQELHYSQVENRTRSSGFWPIAHCIFLVLEFMKESAAHIKYLF